MAHTGPLFIRKFIHALDHTGDAFFGATTETFLEKFLGTDETTFTRSLVRCYCYDYFPKRLRLRESMDRSTSDSNKYESNGIIIRKNYQQIDQTKN